MAEDDYEMIKFLVTRVHEAERRVEEFRSGWTAFAVSQAVINVFLVACIFVLGR